MRRGGLLCRLCHSLHLDYTIALLCVATLIKSFSRGAAEFAEAVKPKLSELPDVLKLHSSEPDEVKKDSLQILTTKP
jgi:hypothetical protein